MKLKTCWLLPADQYERIFNHKKKLFVLPPSFAIGLEAHHHALTSFATCTEKNILTFSQIPRIPSKAAPKNVHEERGWDNTSKTMVDT